MGRRRRNQWLPNKQTNKQQQFTSERHKSTRALFFFTAAESFEGSLLKRVENRREMTNGFQSRKPPTVRSLNSFRRLKGKCCVNDSIAFSTAADFVVVESVLSFFAHFDESSFFFSFNLFRNGSNIKRREALGTFVHDESDPAGQCWRSAAAAD